MPDLLAGRFALHRMLGDGTFAEVWSATDRAAKGTPREVALKIFRPVKGGERHAWDPVEREVAASLRMPPHPNVVKAWAVLGVRFFGDTETPCLVLDRVDGVNLALWLADLPPPGPETVGPRIEVMGGLLRGLAHAHAAGVVHHDLSFGNVLVGKTLLPIARLTDFGCAQVAGAAGGGTDEEEALQPINPPPYSPTVPLAQGARRDVYAFATLCCLALFGRHPLTDEWQSMRKGRWAGAADPHRTLPRRAMADLALWANGIPELPALSDLLLHCVAAEPDLRPPSAVAVLDEWEAVMAAPS